MKEKYIPRITDKEVMDIINSDLTIKEKAQKIQDHDYRMSQKETSKPVYRGDLMPTKFIREVLERE